jgi:DNA-binding MarR family transcriptional regulator
MSKSSSPRSSSATRHARGKRVRTALMDPVPPIEQVVIGMIRAGWAIESRLDKFFSAYGITLLQYNVLRICYARDADGTGIPIGTFGAVVMKLVPDISRLIDRLVNAGLMERLPSPTDRRVVLIRLTQRGFDLIETIHPKLLEHNRALLEHMSEAEVEKVAKGLGRVLEGRLSRRDA